MLFLDLSSHCELRKTKYIFKKCWRAQRVGSGAGATMQGLNNDGLKAHTDVLKSWTAAAESCSFLFSG